MMENHTRMHTVFWENIGRRITNIHMVLLDQNEKLLIPKTLYVTELGGWHILDTLMGDSQYRHQKKWFCGGAAIYAAYLHELHFK
ncbi:hypothetical protein GDO81_011484 [Engystomops pustulosus]|uniref:Uncharacterized protein n=1 Tax=Engystomops pustulosus TaxID=76066 RepID=A0AAV7BEL1_ENGPU|nr:hypothetical protein GDO81_011484 [Engystomops pustulosus]